MIEKKELFREEIKICFIFQMYRLFWMFLHIVCIL